MNNWRGIGIAGWIIAQGLSGQANAAEIRPSTEAPETQGPATPNKASPVFSEDEQRRIRELRQWLKLRQQERKFRQPGSLGGLKEARAPLDLSIPDMSRSGGGFGAAQPKGNPILHIGRGPDGRIHHRYIFNDSGPDQLQSAVPEYAPSNRRSR